MRSCSAQASLTFQLQPVTHSRASFAITTRITTRQTTTSEHPTSWAGEIKSHQRGCVYANRSVPAKPTKKSMEPAQPRSTRHCEVAQARPGHGAVAYPGSSARRGSTRLGLLLPS